MIPALATVSSLQTPLAAILEDYAAGHVAAIDLWLGHADAFLGVHGMAALRERFARHGIAPVAASFQGGLLTSQGDARREHWRTFEGRLALCRDLSLPVLVVAGGVVLEHRLERRLERADGGDGRTHRSYYPIHGAVDRRGS